MHRILCPVDELDERADSAIVMKNVLSAAIVVVAVALVPQHYLSAGAEERELPQPEGERFEAEVNRFEDIAIRSKLDRGAGTLGAPHNRERRDRGSSPERLVMDTAIAAHPCFERLRERVHHGHAHPVKAPRHAVSAASELAPCVQHGQDDLQSGLALPGVYVDWDSATVIVDRD